MKERSKPMIVQITVDYIQGFEVGDTVASEVFFKNEVVVKAIPYLEVGKPEVVLIVGQFNLAKKDGTFPKLIDDKRNTPATELMKKLPSKNKIELSVLHCASAEKYPKTTEQINEVYLQTGFIPSIGDCIENLDSSQDLIITERCLFYRSGLFIYVTEDFVVLPLVHLGSKELPEYFHVD